MAGGGFSKADLPRCVQMLFCPANLFRPLRLSAERPQLLRGQANELMAHCAESFQWQ
jgi:hypothetical protein